MSDAVGQDAAALRLHQAHDHIEGCGLARAVRAQQTHDLAALDLQADAAHHLPAAVGLADLFCRQRVQFLHAYG